MLQFEGIVSKIPEASDPPTLEALRSNYALYETLKFIMQMLRDIIKHLRENETTQIVP